MGIRMSAYGKVAAAAVRSLLRSWMRRVGLLRDLSFSPKCKITVLVEGEVGVLFLRRYVACAMLQPG